MRVYAIKPEIVDKVLGTGVYAAWQQVLDSFVEEQTRAYTNEKRYGQPWAKGIKAQLLADLALAERAADDYAMFLERTTMMGTAIPEEGERILDVLVLAISVLVSVNDLLDEMTNLGLATLLTSLAGASLEIEAKALKVLLEQLRAKLEEAKGDVTEAWAQLAINAAIEAALLCAGPLGWLTLGAVGLGQIVVDQFLGPDTTGFANWGSTATTVLDTAANASEDFLEESSKVLKVTKPAGKVLPVIGFLFDANEISVAYKNVEVLKKLMEKTGRAQDRLVAKIKLHKGVLAAIAIRFEELRSEVEKRTNGWTGEIRQELLEEMRRTGYHPRV